VEKPALNAANSPLVMNNMPIVTCSYLLVGVCPSLMALECLKIKTLLVNWHSAPKWLKILPMSLAVIYFYYVHCTSAVSLYFELWHLFDWSSWLTIFKDVVKAAHRISCVPQI